MPTSLAHKTPAGDLDYDNRMGSLFLSLKSLHCTEMNEIKAICWFVNRTCLCWVLSNFSGISKFSLELK